MYRTAATRWRRTAGFAGVLLAVLGVLWIVGQSETDEEVVRFAVIGDYGIARGSHHPGPDSGESRMAEVAALVKSWDPDFVITVGDNGYSHGAVRLLDDTVGRHYGTFIGGYQGAFGPGPDVNRFFPTLGDHDWLGGVGDGDCLEIASPEGYLEFFSLPGNERYYDVRRGPVHLFALNSMKCLEPDGTRADSEQAEWLRKAAADSDAPFKIAYFHHSPWTSGRYRDGSYRMRWPFQEWGIDAVIAGHDHTYERVQRDGVVYITNGLGGFSYREFQDPVEGSQVRFTGGYGALLVEASRSKMVFKFVTYDNEVVDAFELE